MQLKVMLFTAAALITGTTITLSSNHWIMAWLGLEINTMAIIPLMISSQHPRAIEATTKYFLIQACASASLLFMTLFLFFNTGEWNINNSHPMLTPLIVIILLMKLGVAPLHFWMPGVMQGIPLKTGLILATWQKIAPLILLYQLSTELNMLLMLMFGLLSVLIGGWGMINQTELRKFLAYSSIGHMGWTILALPLSPTMAILNFTLYIIISITQFILFDKLLQKKMADITMLWSYSPPLMCIMLLTILSLAGLLPLTGFMPKMLIIWCMVKKSMIISSALLMTTSLLATYMYIQLTYLMMMLMNPHTTTSLIAWRPKKNINILLIFSATMSILLMPVLPTIMTLMN